jgi:hypothetical protein
MLRFKGRDGENNEMRLGVPGEPIEGQAGAAHYTYDLEEVGRWTQQFTMYRARQTRTVARLRQLFRKWTCYYFVRDHHKKNCAASEALNFLVAHLCETCGTSSSANVNGLSRAAFRTNNGYRNVACGLGFHKITPTELCSYRQSGRNTSSRRVSV